MVPFTTYSNLDDWGIRSAILNKEFGRYVVLYLYDGINQDAKERNDDMFRLYGKEINNTLDSLSLLTVYDTEILDDGFMGREVIDTLKKKFRREEVAPVSSEDMNNNYGMMRKLAAAYHVKLPALIVIDSQSWRSGQEVLFKIELAGATEEDIKNKIISVAEIVKKHYNDFNAISDACQAAIRVSDVVLPEKRSGNMLLYNFLYGYIKEKRQSTFEDTATAVGISYKSLYRYANEYENGKKRPFPRDTAIAVALVLGMTAEETDQMFDMTRVDRLGRLNENDPREHLIRKCLDGKIGLEAANGMLENHGFSPIVARTRTPKKKDS